MAATRLYLPSSGAAAVSPDYSAGWEDTSAATRLKCVRTKISSAMTTVSFTDSDETNKDILIKQWVSDPLHAQTIAAQTVKIQMRGTEASFSSNVFLTWTVKIVSNDGSTVTGTPVSLRRDGVELEWLAGLENRRDSVISTSVAVTEGDRIVIEVGVGGDPSFGGNHNSSISIGDDSGTDLPEDDTTTAAYNPWIEFANAISFQDDTTTSTSTTSSSTSSTSSSSSSTSTSSTSSSSSSTSSTSSSTSSTSSSTSSTSSSTSSSSTSSTSSSTLSSTSTSSSSTSSTSTSTSTNTTTIWHSGSFDLKNEARAEYAEASYI